MLRSGDDVLGENYQGIEECLGKVLGREKKECRE